MAGKQNNQIIERPPVVVVMGHVDHGKSKLLDYIRKTNVVEKEAGGITQRMSAYEVIHKDENGREKIITFIDTPGHEAFSKMRERGASTADIAILVVSAEDGVKAQTTEALKAIKDAGIPYIVAINKIDKPEANVERVKNSLLEHEVYLEGLGGNIPFVAISAITGEGVDDLLNMILLVASLEEITGDISLNASGVVIESNLDPKRGIEATLIIKNGTLKGGMFLVADGSISKTRIFEDFLGNKIKEARFSSPVRIVGFNEIPKAGSVFKSFENRKDAEKALSEKLTGKTRLGGFQDENSEIVLIPLIVKADGSGEIEAIEKEIEKINQEEVAFKIISASVGAISESDLKLATQEHDTFIVGFNVEIDKKLPEITEKDRVTIKTFDIIYKLTEWLEEGLEKHRPRKEIIEVQGKAKILRVFSKTKDKQVIGGRVQEGSLAVNQKVRILRRDHEIGQGVIANLQMNKIEVKSVEEGNECGMMVEAKPEIAEGDVLEMFTMVIK